jgi:hypothetical protein
MVCWRSSNQGYWYINEMMIYFITAWNSISTEYFAHQLEGRETELAVECMVYLRPQIECLNTQCMTYMKPHWRVKENLHFIPLQNAKHTETLFEIKQAWF